MEKVNNEGLQAPDGDQSVGLDTPVTDNICESCSPPLQEMNAMKGIEMTWEEVATELWKIIDNIDTIGDIAKSDDAAFRHMVEKEQKKRLLYMFSPDGYTLKPNFKVIGDGAIAQARAVMLNALLKDPELWTGYQANIAMTIHDMLPDGLEHDLRNQIANRLINVIFG